MRDPAESANSPANSSRTERINEIAHYSRATATCGEKVEGLGSAAAIACGTVLCQNKHIDWCEAQSRDPTARLVIKLLRARAKREDIPTDELRNQCIDPDEVYRLVDQCELPALPEHGNRKLSVRRPTLEPASRSNRKPEKYEYILGDEPVRLCMYGHTYSKSMDQPGKVVNPARGQLNRGNEYFPMRVRA